MRQGSNHTRETRNKISAKRKLTDISIYRTPEYRKKQSDLQKKKARRGEKHWNWNGGRLLREDGYIRILTPEYRKTSTRKRYLLEHRLVMEQHLGRMLERYEEVHHKNGTKTDNRIENLEVVLNKVHFGKTRCPHCLKEFTIK